MTKDEKKRLLNAECDAYNKAQPYKVVTTVCGMSCDCYYGTKEGCEEIKAKSDPKLNPQIVENL